jgi:hypothetical protein
MATDDLNTSKPCDGLAALADCYEALTDLVSTGEPAWVLLLNLNRQLRAFLAEADARGELS